MLKFKKLSDRGVQESNTDVRIPYMADAGLPSFKLVLL